MIPVGIALDQPTLDAVDDMAHDQRISRSRLIRSIVAAAVRDVIPSDPNGDNS